MTIISSRNLANQFKENPKLTKSKRFYVYNNVLGKRICRVLDLINVDGEQKLELVYYYKKDDPTKITNPKLLINDNPIFEEIEDVGEQDDKEIDDDNNPKNFGGNKKSRRVKKNKKRTNKKRTNKKRTNKKRTNKKY